MDAFEPELQQGNLDGLFTGPHYSPRGNKLVAAHILQYIQKCMLEQGSADN